ncbi:hypothetical protein [Streptomyces carpinensis]|uniref:Uncharacterized protein n=1 Tax=Streptomyces carpinensis TaxID=66369 RepID=A0ABV1VVG5_9ACTN
MSTELSSSPGQRKARTALRLDAATADLVDAAHGFAVTGVETLA